MRLTIFRQSRAIPRFFKRGLVLVGQQVDVVLDHRLFLDGQGGDPIFLELGNYG